MAPRKPKVRAALPRRHIFDPWNSSSSGHQTHNNIASRTSKYRQIRQKKLNDQLQDGPEQGDAKVNLLPTMLPPTRRQMKGDDNAPTGFDDAVESKAVACAAPTNPELILSDYQRKMSEPISAHSAQASGPLALMAEGEDRDSAEKAAGFNNKFRQPQSKVFDGCVFYLNSCMPSNGVSDYCLKKLIVCNGGRLSISMAKKIVTHVVVAETRAGNPATPLAGRKMQAEIQRQRGKTLKFVGPSWIIECTKVGKRLNAIAGSGRKIAPPGSSALHQMLSSKRS